MFVCLGVESCTFSSDLPSPFPFAVPFIFLRPSFYSIFPSLFHLSPAYVTPLPLFSLNHVLLTFLLHLFKTGEHPVPIVVMKSHLYAKIIYGWLVYIFALI